jgi:hypothetical protein
MKKTGILLVEGAIGLATMLAGIFSLRFNFVFVKSQIDENPEWNKLAFGAVLCVLTIIISRFRNELRNHFNKTCLLDRTLLYSTHISSWESMVFGGLVTCIAYLLMYNVNTNTHPVAATVVAKMTNGFIIPATTLWFFSQIITICVMKTLKAHQINGECARFRNHIYTPSITEKEFALHLTSYFIGRRFGFKLNNTEKEKNNDYFAQLDRDELSSSYTYSRFLLWAIPVLGFIGTVWGISMSIGGLTKILSNAGVEGLSGPGMEESMKHLSYAFDTTLVALTLGILAMLANSFSEQYEEATLNQCHIILVNKLEFASESTIESATKINNQEIASASIETGTNEKN